MHLDIYRTLCTKQYNIHFLSRAHAFFQIGHILYHKSSLTKFKKIEITPSIISEHHGIKLCISTQRKLKNSQICRD